MMRRNPDGRHTNHPIWHENQYHHVPGQFRAGNKLNAPNAFQAIRRLWPLLALAGAIICFLGYCAFGWLDRTRLSISQPIQAAQEKKMSNVLKPLPRPRSNQRRVIAIGDSHGDKYALVRALQLAHLVDDTNGTLWIGRTDIAVQIGDLLHKAEERDKDTLTYLTSVERQARVAGGGVIVTLGDHDLHNAPRLWKEIIQADPSLNDWKDEPFPSWMHAVHVVDHTLFVHGSLSKQVFDTPNPSIGVSLEEMDEAAKAWLAGTGEKPKWIGRGDGPIWSRLYSDKESDEHPQCDELLKLLNGLNVKRMIVGHTVRKEGISSICDGKVWRIDVGLSATESRAGKIGASEVLELSDGGEKVWVLGTDVKLKSWT